VRVVFLDKTIRYTPLWYWGGGKNGWACVPFFKRGAGGVLIHICITIYTWIYGYPRRLHCNVEVVVLLGLLRDIVLARYDALAPSMGAS
jgi:hypothetical protein